MSRCWSLVAALLLFHALFHAAASAQEAATTHPATSAPASGPEPMVENPRYLAWAKYKPGTQVEFEMNIRNGGQQMTTHVTMTLHEITPGHAFVESVAKLNVRGVVEGQEHSQFHTFNATVPQSEAARALLPQRGQGEMKEAGAEPVEVGGNTYQAKVFEFVGTVDNAPATVKQWRSDEVPGGLVKMQSSTGNRTLEMILTKVTIK